MLDLLRGRPSKNNRERLLFFMIKFRLIMFHLNNYPIYKSIAFVGFMLLYIVIGSYMVLEQAGRYANHKWQWWFDSYQSMIFLALFLMMLIAIMSSYRTEIFSAKEELVKQYDYVRKRLCLNVIVVSLLAAALFPALYLQGFHWYYLCLIYFFCVGFHNISTTPLILSQKTKNNRATGMKRKILRLSMIYATICCPYVLIFGLSLFDESLGYLILFAGIILFSFLCFNHITQLLIKCWNKIVV